MCYPKPGPRCSSHAATRLAKVLAQFEAGKRNKNQTWEEFSQNQKMLDEAQLEFDITPAGLKFLEQEIAQKQKDASQQARYDYALALRQQRLQAVKDNPQTSTHSFVGEIKENETFQPSDVTRTSPADDEEMLTSASQWLHQLNDEEMKEMRWMTDFGAMEANTHIAGANDYSLFGGIYSSSEIEAKMKIVDNVITNYTAPRKEIVYRGVRKGLLPGDMGENYRISNEEKQKTFLSNFKVGELFESEYYMPASSKPGVASKFSDFGVVFEIQTNKAAPVSAISKFPYEAERLIGRKSKFKVVGIVENVQYENFRYEGENPFTVVQLEQI